MDDVNNMDESMDTTEQSPGGVSRRDMIKASVIAGGLVWSAPVLLTGKAAAAAGDPCCPNGTPLTINVPGENPNCGNAQCLDNVLVNFPNGADFPCQDDLTNCLGELNLVVGNFMGGQDDTATVLLAPGVTLIAGAVKTGSLCFYTRCDPNGVFNSGHTTSVTDATNPNICEHQNDISGCGVLNPPLPSTNPVDGRNRIWVEFPVNPTDPTIVHVDESIDPLSQLELSICVAPEVTALCT